MDDERRMLAKILQWAERPEVRAVLLTSTRANPNDPRDAFSDYDVILAVEDIHPFFEDRSWLEDFGRVLVLYRDPIRNLFGFDKFAYITQYESGLKIDFTLFPSGLLSRIAAEPELPDFLDDGYRVLLDKDGLTEGLQPPSYQAFVPAPPDEQTYLTLVEEFFHEATYVAKHLRRGDLLPAKYNLDQAMKQDDLRRMLEWWVEIRHGWALKVRSYGKGLQKHVPQELWAELEATYTGAGTEENWQALFRTIALFHRVALEVGQGLGYTYPQEMERRVRRYLEGVREGR